MALRIIPRPANVQPSARLQLPPSPFVPGATGRFRRKHDMLRELLTWMTGHFKPGTIYGEFEIARAMNVHRVIVNEWLSGLVECGYIVSEVIKNDLLDLQVLAVYIPADKHKEHKRPSSLSFTNLQDFDPWTDRSLDGVVHDAYRPQDYVDKFYYSMHHEYYLVKKQQRVRPNQHMFIPYRSGVFETWKQNGREAPPLSVKDELDKLVSGGRTMQKPT